MFAEACEKAAKFTRPVIISTRSVDGTVSSSCGSFVIINRDGWIVTAGHVFDMYKKFMDDQEKMKELEKKNGPNAVKDPKWLTNHSFWWGWDNVQVGEAYVNREIDVAVGKLINFRPEMISEYPKFKNPEKIKPGTSLCRTGFAFHDTATEYDESSSAFRIKKGVLPIPFFPNDGIHTRNIFRGKSHDGNFDMLYIETSTPGIKGQSGAPIFDKFGYVAGIQVNTVHMPLGFAPTVVNSKGETVVENQFMNLGVGIHVKTLMQVFNARGVKYDSEINDQGFRIID